jgi:flagellar biosynthesis protein FlhG
MARFLPVASGKGGVGKTFFAANISLLLAERGQKVVTIDLDLGGSNLHTVLGMDDSREGIGHFINNDETDFKKIIYPTDYDNFYFVPGDTYCLGTANMPFFVKKKLISQMMQIDADWVILDLGSGATANTLDFFLISNCGILVMIPELTSALNLYSFIKNAFYRYIIRHYHKNSNIRKQLEVRSKSSTIERENDSFSHFLSRIQDEYPSHKEKLNIIVNNFFPKLVLNQGNNERDIAFGAKMGKIINNNLGLNVEYLGFLPEEQYARQCLLEKKPLYTLHKDSHWIRNCNKIVDRLLSFHDYPRALYSSDIDSLDVIYTDMMNIYH